MNIAPRSVLLKGYYGFGNLGDDILCLVAFRLISSCLPGAVVDVYSGNTSSNADCRAPADYHRYISRLLGSEVRIVDWTHRHYYDLVFNGGGGLYKDSDQGSPVSFALNLLSRMLTPDQAYCLESWIRRRSRKELNLRFHRRLGVGIGLGPYTQSSSKYLRAVSELGSYDAIYPRDIRSESFLRRIRFRGEQRLGTDLAFLTDLWAGPTEHRFPGKETSIGVVLMDLPISQGDLLDRLLELCVLLEHGGYDVAVYSFEEHYDQEVSRRWGNRLRVWSPITDDLRRFTDQFREHSLLLTTRAHGAIVGGVLGISSICVAWNRKLREIAEMMPKGCSLMEPTLSVAEMYAFVEQELRRAASRRPDLIAEVGLQMSSAEEMKRDVELSLRSFAQDDELPKSSSSSR